MSKYSNDSGSVLVFITLMIVLLMVIVGMGLDTGFLTLSRSLGQRAVDMAALAGAAGLAKGDVTAIQDNIRQIMVTGNDNDYVDRLKNVIDPTVNDKNVTLITYDFATNKITGTTKDINSAHGVRVALETTNPHTAASSKTAISTPAFLTPLLNLFGSGPVKGANDVNVSAVAVVSAQAGLPIALGVAPATLCSWVSASTSTVIPFTQTSSSGGGGGAATNSSGWTTYLRNATNSNSLVSLIQEIAACQGTGVVDIGTRICLSNGANAAVLQEFETLIGTNPNGTPKCYLAPVIDPTPAFNHCTSPIRSFAQICPMAVCGGTKNQNLCPSGGGMSLVAIVKQCNITDPHQPALSSCYSLRLVRETQAGM